MFNADINYAIYIMDKVEMDEMMGLFCVDILVTLDIFPTEAVPRYALCGRVCACVHSRARVCVYETCVYV